ncbi:transcription termination factor NusA [Erysipelotrichaceae bacterium RD49]|nr:transcription termination factor NusA [Erysipelotrichaceae bacterium RD49]
MPKKGTTNTTRKSKNDNAQAAFLNLHNFRNLPKDVVEEALSDAIEKAYRKRNDLDDARIKTVFDQDGRIKAYRLWDVVETVEFPDYQLDVEEAKDITPNPKVGDVLEEETDIDNFVRGDISTVKSVMLQKIKEAEKKEIIDKYSDKVGDMVTGKVVSVENKFVMVRLGGTPDGKLQPGATDAVMRKSDQIPTETYHEDEVIKVIISKVDKESKGSIVMVSRADNDMIKRLFEKEVPEIYQGTIEIKAIARDPGQRAKMAVLSKRENIDPIGACIGQGGMRVRAISEELAGEKIDIFKWSDDIQELVKNALSPAQGVEIFLAEDAGDKLPADKNPRRVSKDKEGKVHQDQRKTLVAAVPNNQLSLAIGKKGQNAKLAYKLTGHRIDIRSQEELDAAGLDWRSLVEKMHNEYEEKKAQEHAYKQQQRIDELKSASGQTAVMPSLEEFDSDEVFQDQRLPENETGQETSASAQTDNAQDLEEAARIAKENRRSLAERRTTYVSKFESVEPAKPESTPAKPSKPYRKDEGKKEERKFEKKRPAFNTMHPIYTEDELEEIENNELEEEMNASWNEDIDYEEYDSYYDDEY